MRARYWARSFIGWPTVANARPNLAHAALAMFETAGKISMLVTQNVDGLHSHAGHQGVIDLHGRIDRVVCMACNARMPRASVQTLLAQNNPAWIELTAGAAPDGDADLEHTDLSAFQPPSCPHCEGLLKPDVVFFGENVPRARVEAAATALHQADALLVVGSSLMVYSVCRWPSLPVASRAPMHWLRSSCTPIAKRRWLPRTG